MRMPSYAAMAVLLALPLLAGCANPKTDYVAAAPSRLVGMPEQVLLSCAGVPHRQATLDDGSKYYSYLLDRPREDGSRFNVGLGGGGGRVGGGIGISLPLTGGSEPGCDARFTIREGRVAALNFSPERDDTDACYAIVENCLGVRPAQQ